MTTHSSVLAWEIPWTEDPRRRYNVATKGPPCLEVPGGGDRASLLVVGRD